MASPSSKETAHPAQFSMARLSGSVSHGVTTPANTTDTNIPQNFREVVIQDRGASSSRGIEIDEVSHSPVGSPMNDSTIRQPLLPVSSEGDFATIDWQSSHTRDRSRRSRVQAKWKSGRFKEMMLLAFDSAQGWILVSLIGCTMGVVAAMIDTGVEWVQDLKYGYCDSGFWLSKGVCCREQQDVEKCTAWVDWNEIVGVDGESSAYWINYLFYIISACLFGGLSSWLVIVFAPYAAGSGIPEMKTILGGFVIKRFLGGWTLLIKCVGLVLSVGAGLNLGKEGPYVHVAACCGNTWTRLFPKFSHNEAKKREILSASAAAGVSVAFGAPVGGVLFSLEEASSYFPHKTMWRSFACAIVAALVLQTIDPFKTGKLTLYQVNYSHPWRSFELIPFIFLGVLGGLIGAFFNFMNIRVCSLRKKSGLKKWPVLEVVIVCFVTSVINYSSLYLRGGSSELISILFSECDDFDYVSDQSGLCDPDNVMVAVRGLLLGALVKLGLTVFTFGLKVPAGLFIPSMAIGACLGRLVGTGVQNLYENDPSNPIFAACDNTSHCVTPGMYALVGAAATLGGVTRMTVSLVVIMFELTGGLQYILPIMVAVMVAKWVGDAFGRESIYDEHIRLNGYPFLDNKAEIGFAARAADVMTSQTLRYLTLHGNTVQSLETILEVTPYRGFPIVSTGQDMLLVGYVSRGDLAKVLSDARKSGTANDYTVCMFSRQYMDPMHSSTLDISSIVEKSPSQIVEETPLDRVFEMFKQMGLSYCIVTRDAQLVGIIRKKDLLDYLERKENQAIPTPQSTPQRDNQMQRRLTSRTQNP